MDARIGAVVVLAGLVIVAVGLIAMTGALSWVGRLPGDLRWEGGSTRIYVPITTMIIVSVVLSLLSLLLRRL